MGVRLADDADRGPAGVGQDGGLGAVGLDDGPVEEAIGGDGCPHGRGVVAQLADLGRRLVDEAEVTVDHPDRPVDEEGVAEAVGQQLGHLTTGPRSRPWPRTRMWRPAESRPRTSRRSRLLRACCTLNRAGQAGTIGADVAGPRPEPASSTTSAGGPEAVPLDGPEGVLEGHQGLVDRLEGGDGVALGPPGRPRWPRPDPGSGRSAAASSSANAGAPSIAARPASPRSSWSISADPRASAADRRPAASPSAPAAGKPARVVRTRSSRSSVFGLCPVGSAPDDGDDSTHGSCTPPRSLGPAGVRLPSVRDGGGRWAAGGGVAQRRRPSAGGGGRCRGRSRRPARPTRRSQADRAVVASSVLDHDPEQRLGARWPGPGPGRRRRARPRSRPRRRRRWRPPGRPTRLASRTFSRTWGTRWPCWSRPAPPAAARSGHDHVEQLDPGQDAVAGGGQVPADHVAGLLAAEGDLAVLERLQDVAVTDLGGHDGDPPTRPWPGGSRGWSSR